MALSLLSAIQGAFQGPAPIQGRVTATSRATVPRALDVVVAPDAKPPAAKEELPDYMKSKRNLYPRKCDVMDEIENFVQEQIDGGLLLNPEKAWQPSDFLPDSQKPTDEWFDEVREMRKVAADLPDELLLVLIGDMITEEALPTYLTLLNTLEGTDDPTGRRGHGVGSLVAAVDLRGEPARRPAQPVPVPHRAGGHARDRADHHAPDLVGLRSRHALRPLPGLHLHLLPGVPPTPAARNPAPNPPPRPKPAP